MSRVHKALEALHPREWADFPRDADLKPFLQDTLQQAELIVASVPQPPGGSPFESSQPAPHLAHPNAATSAQEIHLSTARGPDPNIPDFEALQKGWGKPVKIGPKDNPLGMSVWKMAGHDRHGAWFARRSVHEGLGFTKWKKAMQREFAHSLAIDGGPGEGSVRGIGADRRLEREIVEGVGQLDVYQLSAQFPGPVAPREFITCLVTSESALSDVSAAQVNGSKTIPRHYVVVSIPCEHPEAPIGTSLVRGSYESVEMIREIPIHTAKSKSTPNLLSPKEDPRHSDSHSERVDVREHKDQDPEMNPVEWIMITRSDPGGGIPRFMVERNTPASIATDAVKFLNWATSLEEIPDPDHDADVQEEVQEKRLERERSRDLTAVDTNGHLAGILPATPGSSVTGAFEPSGPNDTGIIASLTNTASSYVPDIVKERLGMNTEDRSTEQFPAYAESTSSDDSFNSVPEMTADWKTAYEGPQTPDPLDDTESSLSFAQDDASDSTNTNNKDFENSSDHRHYERELKKLAQRRKTLDARLEKSREAERKKKEELQTKEEKDAAKQRERLERDKAKQEERYRKEMEKLEAKREREEKKMQEKRQKARDKDANARDRRERDEYRRRVELLQRENELLRRQLGDLQRENTVLVQRVGKLSDGQSVVRQVREELERRSVALPRTSSELAFRTDLGAGGGGAEKSGRASSVQSRDTGASKRSGAEKSKLSDKGTASASEEHIVTP